MTTEQIAEAEPKKENAGRYWLRVIAEETTDPLQMIGAALTGLLEVVTDAYEEPADDEDTSLRAEYDQLEQTIGQERDKLDAIAAAVKKSTSAVSLTVKAILEGQPAPAEPVEATHGGAADA